MLKYYDTNRHADLRKKNTFSDTIEYSKLNICFQSCMVIFAVIAILLLSIFFVVVAQNPTVV